MAMHPGLKPWGPDNPPPKSPGRPPERPVSQPYEAWLREPISAERLAKFKSDGVNFRKGATNADVVAFALGNKAIRGDVSAAKELREGVQGKAPQEITVNADRQPEFVVVYATPIPGARPAEGALNGNGASGSDGVKLLEIAAFEDEDEEPEPGANGNGASG